MERHGLGRREALRRLTLGGLGVASLPAWVEALTGLAEARGHEHATAPAAPAADWKPKALDAHQDETVATIRRALLVRRCADELNRSRACRHNDAMRPAVRCRRRLRSRR